MKKWIHTIYSENRGFLNWEDVKKNYFGRYFPIFNEIRGINSYATNESSMLEIH